MENYRFPLWIATALGCMLIVFVVLLNIHQYQLIRRPSQLLSVSATGKVESVQDVAIVSLGVTSEGASAQVVKDQSSSKINQVIAFVKQTGISDNNIKTSQFNLSPKYSYNNQQQTLVGYQANQVITIKVMGIDKSSQQLEQIIDGAVTHGANQIQGVDFSFSDNASLILNAQKQAIDKAIVNAKQIANNAGLKLGRVVNVLTSAADTPQPMFMENMTLAKSASSSRIEVGSQEVSATLTVVFEIN